MIPVIYGWELLATMAVSTSVVLTILVFIAGIQDMTSSFWERRKFALPYNMDAINDDGESSNEYWDRRRFILF